MKLLELFYIVEGYKEAETEFSKIADAATVRQAIETYKMLVNKNQFTGNERNIDYWRKQGWDSFYDTVTKIAATPTATQTKRSKVTGRSITLVEDNRWLIVIPLDKSASCFHGKNTDWCTTKPDRGYYENYFYDRNVTLIYCLNKVDGSKWAIAAHPKIERIECFDRDDNSLSEQEFESATGLNPLEIVRHAHADFSKEIETSRTEYKSAMEKLRQLRLQGKLTRSEELEQLLMFVKDADLCASYISFNRHGNYPAAIVLPAIVVSPALVQYVENLTPKLVATIARDSPETLSYIDDVSIEIQRQVVAADPNNIEFLQKPAEEIQKQVLAEYPFMIDRVHNLSYEAAKIAVKEDPVQIENSHYQTPEIQAIAVKEDPYVIRFIENPAVEVQELAIRALPVLISRIKSPPREIQLLAVKVAEEQDYSASDMEELKSSIRRSALCPELLWDRYQRVWTRNINATDTTGEFLPGADEENMRAHMVKFIKDVDNLGYDNLETKESQEGYNLVKEFINRYKD